MYADAVYPVFPGNLINISGASWEVEDCDRFLFAGAAVPYALRADKAVEQHEFDGFHGEWNVETNRFGHYVVFNASERLAAAVVDALETNGLSVQRWDVSDRPSSDGKFYDWFARLRLKTIHDEAASLVSAVFSSVAANTTVEAPLEPAVTRLEDLSAQVEQLIDLTFELKERLHASDSEVARCARSSRPQRPANRNYPQP